MHLKASRVVHPVDAFTPFFSKKHTKRAASLFLPFSVLMPARATSSGKALLFVRCTTLGIVEHNRAVEKGTVRRWTPEVTRMADKDKNYCEYSNGYLQEGHTEGR
ncbi:MAG: hypothetical protein SWQ30_22270 [Thermodesulfobacteriota bacterium]|nr:hypothetical protein [Thermodesulfobacteriota bacterium]